MHRAQGLGCARISGPGYTRRHGPGNSLSARTPIVTFNHIDCRNCRKTRQLYPPSASTKGCNSNTYTERQCQTTGYRTSTLTFSSCLHPQTTHTHVPQLVLYTKQQVQQVCIIVLVYTCKSAHERTHTCTLAYTRTCPIQASRTGFLPCPLTARLESGLSATSAADTDGSAAAAAAAAEAGQCCCYCYCCCPYCCPYCCRVAARTCAGRTAHAHAAGAKTQSNLSTHASTCVVGGGEQGQKLVDARRLDAVVRLAAHHTHTSKPSHTRPWRDSSKSSMCARQACSQQQG
eukprot:659971-Pelagomonas_calceolata.AAC.2